MTVEIGRKYIVEFKSKNDTVEEIELPNVDNKVDAYDKAREKICNKHNISIMDFEDNWELDGRRQYISFKNKPWDDYDELKSDIESIDGVRSINHIPQYFGPPQVYVTIKPSAVKKKVQGLVKDYFEGLIVEINNNGLTITIDPSQFE